MAHVQALGLLRFSYPRRPEYKGETDLESHRNNLYDPARMERRLLWFEHVVLPGLRNQTDPDFLCPMLVGDQLPEPYRGRLVEMAATVPQIRVTFEPEGQDESLLIKTLVARYSDLSADAVAEFKLDDDDGVADNFVELARSYFTLVQPLMDEYDRVTLDFCSGIILRADKNGVDAKSMQYRLWGLALVTYRRPEMRTIFRFVPHLEIWKTMPCLSLPSPPMFVRGAHEDNVSQLSDRWDQFGDEDQNPAEVRKILSSRFGIDLDAMARARAKLE